MQVTGDPVPVAHHGEPGGVGAPLRQLESHRGLVRECSQCLDDDGRERCGPACPSDDEHAERVPASADEVERGEWTRDPSGCSATRARPSTVASAVTIGSPWRNAVTVNDPGCRRSRPRIASARRPTAVRTAITGVPSGVASSTGTAIPAVSAAAMLAAFDATSSRTASGSSPDSSRRAISSSARDQRSRSRASS